MLKSTSRRDRFVSPAIMARIAEEFRARRAALGTPVKTRQNKRTFRFGAGFELDIAAYELRSNGEPLKLSRIPMELLHLLVERPGQLVSRDEIVKRIWGREEVSVDTDRNINDTIRRVRRVLQDNAEQPRFVQTVYSKGYRFIAPVSSGPEHQVGLIRNESVDRVLRQGRSSSEETGAPVHSVPATANGSCSRLDSQETRTLHNSLN